MMIPAGLGSVVAGGAEVCFKLCTTIGQLLMEAKWNKAECRSLHSLSNSILQFLSQEQLPNGVEDALGRLQVVLDEALALLVKVSQTGPLRSLLMADHFRNEFVRINRDLYQMFSVVSAQLRIRNDVNKQLDLVLEELRATRSTFFSSPDKTRTSLVDAAAAAREEQMPEEALHTRLLGQLKGVPELEGLDPEQLWEELVELQRMQHEFYAHPPAPSRGASSGALAKDMCCGISNEQEDFLVEQLIAALSPRVAALPHALAAGAAFAAPEEYLCPISRQLMSDPVVLAQTGHLFDRVNIQKWLLAHSTCPVTNARLHSKQLVPVHGLRSSIAAWAEVHGLPADPAAATAAGAAAGAASSAALARTSSGRQPSSARSSSAVVGDVAAVLTVQPGADDSGAVRDVEAGGAGGAAAAAAKLPPPEGKGAAAVTAPRRCCPRPRCTRTLWAAALMAAVVAATALALGLTLGLVLRPRGAASSPPPPTQSRQQPPAASAPPAAPQASRRAAELKALLDVKDALDRGGLLLKTWRNSREAANGAYCDWPGVGCDRDGCVIALRLMDPPQGDGVLSGTLPSGTVLQQLPCLEEFSCKDRCGLTGTLPADWSSLAGLREVNIWRTRLNGGGITGPLPAAWGDLTSSLRAVDLADNDITGTLPPAWGNLTALSRLILWANPKLVGPLPDAWKGLGNLEDFRVGDQRINGTLPASWGGGWRNVSYLSARNASLRGPLPSAWQGMKRLKQLRLSLNWLTGSLPASWSNLTALETLEVDDNEINGTIPGAWGGGLPNLTSGMVNLRNANFTLNYNLTVCPPTSWEARRVQVLGASAACKAPPSPTPVG